MSHLQTYKIQNNIYLIGGFLNPISIKDQLSRVLLVLSDSELIKVERVAVVGNGVVGAFLAHLLGTKGKEVTLYGPDEDTFLKNRKLNLFQYDWPLDDWSRSSEQLPLRQNRHIKIQDVDSLLSFRQHVTSVYECVDLVDGVDPKGLTIETQNGKLEFDAIFICVGFGGERCTVNMLNPSQNVSHTQTDEYGFWGSKRESEINKSNKILISGGGDGGLQEFILCCTKFDHAKEAYEEWELERVLDMDRLKTIFTTHLNLRLNGCNDLKKLDNELRAIIKQAFKEDDNLKDRIKKELSGKSVYLNLPPPHDLDKQVQATKGQYSSSDVIKYNLDQCYPLNRLIVYTLMEYYMQIGDPRVSFGMLTEITMSGPLYSPKDLQLTPVNMPTEFDLILIRHGIDRSFFEKLDKERKTQRNQLFPHKLSDIASLVSIF